MVDDNVLVAIVVDNHQDGGHGEIEHIDRVEINKSMETYKNNVFTLASLVKANALGLINKHGNLTWTFDMADTRGDDPWAKRWRTVINYLNDGSDDFMKVFETCKHEYIINRITGSLTDPDDISYGFTVFKVCKYCGELKEDEYDPNL